MLKVCLTDIKGFSLNEWEDMLSTSRVYESDWEGWDERKQVKFTEYKDRIGTDGLPVKEFVLDMEHEGEEVKFSEELEYLVKDIIDLRLAKETLYRASMQCFTEFVEEGVNMAAGCFEEAYDGAMARVLELMLKELLATRGA